MVQPACQYFWSDSRKELFEIFDSYRILCVQVIQGQLGTQSINQKMT